MAILTAPAPLTTTPTTETPETSPVESAEKSATPAASADTGKSAPSSSTSQPADPLAKARADLDAKLESLTKADLSLKEKNRLSDLAIKKYEENREFLELLEAGDIRGALRKKLGDKYDAGNILMDLAVDAAPEELTPEQIVEKKLAERDAKAAKEAAELKAKQDKEAQEAADLGLKTNVGHSAEFLLKAVGEGKYPLIKKWDADPDVDHEAEYTKLLLKHIDETGEIPGFEVIWDQIEAKYAKRRAYYMEEKPPELTLWDELNAERAKGPPPERPRGPLPALSNGSILSGSDEARRRLMEADEEDRVRAMQKYRGIGR